MNGQISCCLVRATEAVKAGLHILSSSRTIYGWGAMKQAAEESIGTNGIDIEIDGVTVKVEVIVVFYQIQPVGFIVDRSWLDDQRVIFVKKRRTLDSNVTRMNWRRTRS